ncbi:MAG: hypothetical protein Fur006_31010 [Coleofasciculaceae cyanobacterium]
MIEPFSLSAGAIATLVLTKAIEKTLEKTSEKLGEKVLEKGGELMKQLKRGSSDTASAIEAVAQDPELAEQEPEYYGIAVLEEKVNEAASSDPKIAAAVEALANAVKSQPEINQTIRNIVENNYGGYAAPGGTISVEEDKRNQTFNI